METKKKFFYFNIIDIIILVAILAIACALIFRTPSNIDENESGILDSVKVSSIEYTKNIKYTMKISSLQKASGNLIKVGDYIYNHVTDGTIGKVTEVRVDEAELYVSLSNGEIVKRRTPNRIDIFVTLVAPAYIDKTGHYLEDYIFICSNKELNCYTQNLDFIGVVQTVDEIRESNLGKDTLLEGTPIAPEGAETSNSANAKSEESVNNSVNELN